MLGRLGHATLSKQSGFGKYLARISASFDMKDSFIKLFTLLTKLEHERIVVVS